MGYVTTFDQALVAAPRAGQGAVQVAC